MMFLHRHNTNTFYLDHMLTPEVRAMLAAMTSRMPLGGVQQRYEELLEAMVLPSVVGKLVATKEEARVDSRYDAWMSNAEDLLHEYPLNPKVQEFFDKFVGAYGHSSIIELSGSPTVFIENISWWTAWLLFDSPLVAGQENSTRAVTRKGWPMCLEAQDLQVPADINRDHTVSAPNPTLQKLHERWMEVFEAEVKAWTEHLKDEGNRKALGIGDKEPFRPALDRARWALPGTISTGVAFASHVRERARAIQTGSLLAQASGHQAAIRIFQEIEGAYREALPGLAGLGLKESVYGPSSRIPGHLQLVTVLPKTKPDIDLMFIENLGVSVPYMRQGENQYLDPLYNQTHRVTIRMQCSLAVARDWHRHRTLYPMQLAPVMSPRRSFVLSPHYEPMSAWGKEACEELLADSAKAFLKADSNVYQAMLTIPFGALVELSWSGGLRDTMYCLELRKNTPGANFEYKDQAEQMLKMLHEALGEQDEDV